MVKCKTHSWQEANVKWTCSLCDPEITATINLVNNGKACKLAGCLPGFFMYNNKIFFKSEYKNDIYCIDSGECFWGGTHTFIDRDNLIVQPLKRILS
jgi:hypothetical protein